MHSVAWTRDGDIRVATLGDRVGQMLPVGSRFAWKVGHVSGLDDEAAARRNVEEMLSGQVSPPVVAPPEPAANALLDRLENTDAKAVLRLAAEFPPAPNALPAWAATPEDDGRAVRRDWTAERYHSDSRTSRSDLELFRADPAAYHAIKTGELEREETAALWRGQLLHLAVLEPAEFARRVVVAPETDDDFKGAGAKARRESWKRELAAWRARQPADAIIVDADDKDLARVHGMAHAIRTLQTPNAKQARGLLFGAGETELTITWRDEDPELAQPMGCKARLDRLLVAPSAGVLVVDLKSTEDPSEEGFARSIGSYGYHRQAAWYCHAAQALIGTSLPRFAFVVVRSTPPHTVAVYELEPEAIAIGAAEIRESLRALSRAMADNNWTAPWERGVKKINLPLWARRKGELMLAAKEIR